MLRAAGVLPPAPTSPLPAAAADPTVGGEGGECTPLLGGYAEEFVWVQVDEPLPDA